VIAQNLADRGCKVFIVLCCGAPAGDAPRDAYRRAVEAGVPVIDLEMESQKVHSLLGSADFVVDAVFGIGFKGDLPYRIGDLFAAVNRTQLAVYAIDMPSGIDSDTGTAAENTLEADVTLYVIGEKPAHLFKISRALCGKLRYLDIGIPAKAYESVPEMCAELVTDIAKEILPHRREDGHKWQFGSVVLACGSDRYRGAAALSVRGALAGGAGLIQVVSTEKVLAAIAAQSPECILLDTASDAAGVSDAFSRASAVVVGPGLFPDTADALLGRILPSVQVPVVVDAEGINAIARNINMLENRKQPLILTPHVGEFARLTGAESSAVHASRMRFAREFAQQHRVVLVLKSENTVVALPSGEVYVCTIGNAGMARGGSGDLLSGLLGSLCAMGIDPGKAAVLGVWLHSRAADLAVRFRPEHTLTPSVIAGFLPEAMSDLS